MAQHMTSQDPLGPIVHGGKVRRTQIHDVDAQDADVAKLVLVGGLRVAPGQQLRGVGVLQL